MDEKKKILIIENDRDIRSVYADLLRENGYIVMESDNVSSGLECVNQGEWDLMFLDIMLPQRGGIEILSNIKNNSQLCNKPFILITSLGKEHFDMESNLKPAGYLDTLQNNPGDIIALVNMILKPQQITSIY